MGQMVVVERALVQGLVKYLLGQPLGEVLNFYQLLQQALATPVVPVTPAPPALVKKPSPPPPNPAD